MIRPKLTAIDLFFGCVGLSLGLRRAGFRVLAAVDSDELATSIYKMNHRRTHLFSGDIRNFDADTARVQLELEIGELDLLVGCPPCQGFSSLRALNGSKNIVDPQNDLIFDFLRFVEGFLPRSIMMENVPALIRDTRLDKFKIRLDKFKIRLDKFKIRLDKLGYKFDADVFDA